MGKKLYVGNLSYSATEDGLRQLFSESGNVTSVSIVMNRDTGQSRGFGFIEMETDEAAQNAISALNGVDHMGRKLNISEAREGGGGGGGGGGGRGPRRDFRGGGGGGGGYRDGGGGGHRDGGGGGHRDGGRDRDRGGRDRDGGGDRRRGGGDGGGGRY